MALHFVAEAIAANPNVSLIYSDEDKIDQSNNRYDPYFKCDYNYELLLAHNMICHLTVSSPELDQRDRWVSAQDSKARRTTTWRCARSNRVGSDQVLHIPRVLYHWRAHRGSTASTVRCKAVCGGGRTSGGSGTPAADAALSELWWRRPRHRQ